MALDLFSSLPAELVDRLRVTVVMNTHFAQGDTLDVQNITIESRSNKDRVVVYVSEETFARLLTVNRALRLTRFDDARCETVQMPLLARFGEEASGEIAAWVAMQIPKAEPDFHCPSCGKPSWRDDVKFVMREDLAPKFINPESKYGASLCPDCRAENDAERKRLADEAEKALERLANAVDASGR